MGGRNFEEIPREESAQIFSRARVYFAVFAKSIDHLQSTKTSTRVPRITMETRKALDGGR